MGAKPTMRQPSPGFRAQGRLSRAARATRHSWQDGALLQALKSGRFLERAALREVAARMGGAEILAAAGLAEQGGAAAAGSGVTATAAAAAGWRAEAVRAAAGALQDRVVCLGQHFDLKAPDVWRRDPLRSKPWPRRPHAQIRLDVPDRPGDVRVVWEPARFQHALLLARAYRTTHEHAYVEAFLRHADSFEHANPPYRGVHWSVGMEVAIRATNWIFACEQFRGAPALDEIWRLRLTRSLLIHGAFIEHHLERHPLGFTTNHTIADYAGLAVLGRFFAGTDCGTRWMDMAAEGLRACLQDQVLIGGAHAEGSLPYERFVLEACVTSATCLGKERTDRLRRPVRWMAAHLGELRLAQEIPFVGDGDDSFFPPFGDLPDPECRPLDPEPVLRAVARWLDEATGDGPVQLRAATVLPASDDAARLAPTEASFWQHRGGGGVRFRMGPFDGVLIARGRGEGWLPTHAHNDLLSLILEVRGQPLLIDPGTGGYASDRALRHLLRSTAAHSTVQLDDLEQSAIRERATFEGPLVVAGGIDRFKEQPLRVCAWHGGFDERDLHAAYAAGLRPSAGLDRRRRSWEKGGSDNQHTRRVFGIRGGLCIEDVVFNPILAGEQGQRAGEAGEERTTTLRFRLSPGLAPRVVAGSADRVPGTQLQAGLWDEPQPPASLGDARPPRAGCVCEVDVEGGRVRFLLLRPRDALWQIESGVISRRYGERADAPVLTASMRGPLPHRWLTVVQFRPHE
jgi:hypothetical protein